MSKFAIIDAVEKPKTRAPAYSFIRGRTWTWAKAFLCQTKKDKKPMRGNQLGQTGNQWAKRQNVAARFQSFRYTLDGSDGVFVQRVA